MPAKGERHTLAPEVPKARLTEVLRPKAPLCHEVVVGLLLQDDMVQAAIPFAPRRHRRRRIQSVGNTSTLRRLPGAGSPLTLGHRPPGASRATADHLRGPAG